MVEIIEDKDTINGRSLTVRVDKTNDDFIDEIFFGKNKLEVINTNKTFSFTFPLDMTNEEIITSIEENLKKQMNEVKDFKTKFDNRKALTRLTDTIVNIS